MRADRIFLPNTGFGKTAWAFGSLTSIKTDENPRTTFCSITLEKLREELKLSQKLEEGWPMWQFSDPTHDVSGGGNSDQEARINQSNWPWKESDCVCRNSFAVNDAPFMKPLPYCLAWLQHMNPVLLPEEAIGVRPQWDNENWVPYCNRHCSTAFSLTPPKCGWVQEIISSFGVIFTLLSSALKLPLCSTLYYVLSSQFTHFLFSIFFFFHFGLMIHPHVLQGQEQLHMIWCVKRGGIYRNLEAFL